MTGEEHREIEARLHQVGRNTQKEYLETDTGIRYVCIELLVSRLWLFWVLDLEGSEAPLFNKVTFFPVYVSTLLT